MRTCSNCRHSYDEACYPTGCPRGCQLAERVEPARDPAIDDVPFEVPPMEQAATEWARPGGIIEFIRQKMIDGFSDREIEDELARAFPRGWGLRP